MSKRDKWSEKKQDEVEKRAKKDTDKVEDYRPNQAWCTECKQWYDANNAAQLNRHGH